MVDYFEKGKKRKDKKRKKERERVNNDKAKRKEEDAKGKKGEENQEGKQIRHDPSLLTNLNPSKEGISQQTGIDGFSSSVSSSYGYICCGNLYSWAVWADCDYTLL